MKASIIADACLFGGQVAMLVGASMIYLDRRGQRPQTGRVGWKVLSCGAIISIIFDVFKLFFAFHA